MLTAETIVALIADGESATVEFKQSIPKDQNLGETICAFANDINATRGPSYMLLGVADNGTIVGIDASDVTLQRLAQVRMDGSITPIPSMTVRKLSVQGKSVITVQVDPSNSPPVRRNGTAFVRAGAVTTKATPEEERRLVELRRGRALSPDMESFPGSSPDDLDLRRFRLDYLPRAVSPEVLAENNRTVDQQLMALKMINDKREITVTGMIVLGIDPLRWLPAAYIQFRRVRGKEIYDETIDHSVISGTIDVMIRKIEEKFESINMISLTIGDFQHKIQSNYPASAFQQIVRNAVMHRDYGMSAPIRVTWFDDRVQIDSPGDPFGMPIDKFGQPGLTSYRNLNLAEAMHNLGFVERFGAGLGIARDALAKNGNPPLDLKSESGFVCAILWVRT